MTARTIALVVGARPNFVKVAPVWRGLAEDPEWTPYLVHTGQHYDRQMSGAFFEQLRLPDPDWSLGVGSGTHAEQTAGVMIGIERILMEQQIDALLVAGDVNSTLGAGLAAVKCGVPLVHLEAGLRSNDWSMPEEVNRVLVDRISDLLLTHSPEAEVNLSREGIDPSRVANVGNTMIDSLFDLLPTATAAGALGRLGLERNGYALVTLHRPALVDDVERLSEVIDALADLSTHVPVVFPAHPRTRARIESAMTPPAGIRLMDPLDYLDFIALEEAARLVITDSGGVQEETTALGVPCITYRSSTERPVTITHGSNRLVGLDPSKLRAATLDALAGPARITPSVSGWDGAAGGRAAAAITAWARSELPE